MIIALFVFARLPSAAMYSSAIFRFAACNPPSFPIDSATAVTAAAAKKQGFTVHIYQEEFTIPGMVESLVARFSGHTVEAHQLPWHVQQAPDGGATQPQPDPNQFIGGGAPYEVTILSGGAASPPAA